MGCGIQRVENLPELKVLLVNSKIERNTSRMVTLVKERFKKFPDVVENIFNAIDAVSREAVAILSHGPRQQQKSTCTDEEHFNLQVSANNLDCMPFDHNAMPDVYGMD
ncbi:unnamed protein product [Soboliphyme baturini]|uniref:GLOBIN domain-containing protein n=1 Tax=Soboliphyme baturini TaxID=241478 RepID=A0A183IW82_9BILA|nr:unnamed protein product [Soboliphyme baturini]